MSSISFNSSSNSSLGPLFTIEERSESPVLPPLPTPTVQEDAALESGRVSLRGANESPTLMPAIATFSYEQYVVMAQVLSSQFCVYATEGKLDEIKALLQKYQFLYLDRDYLCPALEIAVRDNKVEVVKELLQYKSFLRPEDFTNSILIASKNNNLEIQSLLQTA